MSRRISGRGNGRDDGRGSHLAELELGGVVAPAASPSSSGVGYPQALGGLPGDAPCGPGAGAPWGDGGAGAGVGAPLGGGAHGGAARGLGVAVAPWAGEWPGAELEAVGLGAGAAIRAARLRDAERAAGRGDLRAAVAIMLQVLEAGG